MTTLPPRLFVDLIGKPFAEGGRGPGAYDCVGLAIEIQRRLGAQVPEFISSESELHRQMATGGFLGNCIKVQQPLPGCIALLRMGPHEHHLGTMIDRYRMIHTTAQTRGAVIEPILGPLWNRRIVGFYQLGRPAVRWIDTRPLQPGIGAYPCGDDGK